LRRAATDLKQAFTAKKFVFSQQKAMPNVVIFWSFS
jgi:hypothetical protein